MPEPEAERQLIAFTLHGERYALPIAAVREIIRYTAPSATATARGPIRGLINLRDRVLPVVDLSQRLGKTLQVTRATRILVLEVTAGALGLIVDSVQGVRAIPEREIGPLPVVAGEAALGGEITAHGGELIVLIDPERTLGPILTPAADRPKGGWRLS
jgi:purine-binding chemotaxis protein CheW